MPDKGKIMSQTYYERQSRLVELFKEAFVRKEMNLNETTAALRTLGFGKLMASNRVREWAVLSADHEPETEKAAKLRHKQQAVLERYFARMNRKKKSKKKE